MPVIKVKPWSPDQGEFVLINVADFDPTKHQLIDAEQLAAPPTPIKPKKAKE